MSEKRRGLGRGLGALIPTTPPAGTGDRPVDVFFPGKNDGTDSKATATGKAAIGVITQERPPNPSAPPCAPEARAGDGRLQGEVHTSRNGASTGGNSAGTTTARRPGGTHPLFTGPAAADGPVNAEATAESSPTSTGGDTAGSGGRREVDRSRRDRIWFRSPGRSSPSSRSPRSGRTPGSRGRSSTRRPSPNWSTRSGRSVSCSRSSSAAPSPRTVRPGTSSSWVSVAGGPPRTPVWSGSRRSSGTPPTTQMLRDALLENLHRSELNPLEEAAAYQQLLEDFGCTHEELATGSAGPGRRSATRSGC